MDENYRHIYAQGLMGVGLCLAQEGTLYSNHNPQKGMIFKSLRLRNIDPFRDIYADKLYEIMSGMMTDCIGTENGSFKHVSRQSPFSLMAKTYLEKLGVLNQ